MDMGEPLAGVGTKIFCIKFHKLNALLIFAA